VRYADDLVGGFEHEDEARRFLDAMRERFEAFPLSLHPGKTRRLTATRQSTARNAAWTGEDRLGRSRSRRSPCKSWARTERRDPMDHEGSLV